LLQTLFQEQTQNWETYSFAHLEEVRRIVKRFSDALYERTILDENVRRKIQAYLHNQATTSIAAARTQLNQILKDEREGILQTVNHYYAETLNKIRQDRLIEMLTEHLDATATKCSIGYHRPPIAAASLAQKISLGNEDQAVFDIHDILKAYYNVAMKRFIDNVVVQVVERCFLLKGPLTFFNTELIGGLSDKDLVSLAAEDYVSSTKRNELSNRIDRLDAAIRLANSF